MNQTKMQEERLPARADSHKAPLSPGILRPTILSGGSGTRLWPLSRHDRPKQLMSLSGERTLLQLTALRTIEPGRFARPYIVGNAHHSAEILRQLSAVGVTPERIILEPIARNTAPAIALAAFESAPDDLLLVMPSDHIIEDEAAFLGAIEMAMPFARGGWLVTFGMTPTRPETGFGYIRRSDRISDRVYEVAEFVEKPRAELAREWVASGDYLWNGGIFLFSARAYLAELAQSAPEVFSAARDAVTCGMTVGGFMTPDADAFARAPSISIDYAVMENARRIAVVHSDIGWSDLGSWDALYELSSGDESANRLTGNVIVEGTTGCLIYAAGPTVAGLGLENLTIIATPDAILVMPKGRSQDISRVIAELKARGSATLRSMDDLRNLCCCVPGASSEL